MSAPPGDGYREAWDRGFHSFDMVQAALLTRGCELLGRLPATVKPKVLATLADGTQLVWLRPRPITDGANEGSAFWYA